MFKVAVVARRNPSLSVEQFRSHYELVHAPLAASLMPKMRRYTRHFAMPYGNPTYEAGARGEFDMITEMWFDSEADFTEAMAHLSTPSAIASLGADETILFENGSIRIFTLEDRGDVID